MTIFSPTHTFPIFNRTFQLMQQPLFLPLPFSFHFLFFFFSSSTFFLFFFLNERGEFTNMKTRTLYAFISFTLSNVSKIVNTLEINSTNSANVSTLPSVRYHYKYAFRTFEQGTLIAFIIMRLSNEPTTGASHTSIHHLSLLLYPLPLR